MFVCLLAFRPYFEMKAQLNEALEVSLAMTFGCNDCLAVLHKEKRMVLHEFLLRQDF